ncbi:MAG TPA: DUF6111 family protein [Alphaproteobacteria bacterium]|nr:DUF6111 family protein [Alphaproteobacteria bacterium]
MLRVLLEYIVPIVLPSLLYLAWIAYENRRIARGGEGVLRRWQEGPWAWLFAAGVVLAVAGTLMLSLLRGYGIEGQYVPPRVEDGRIVPGHVEPAQPRR